MIPRKQRAMDAYETAGAEMRLLKQLGAKAVMDAGKIFISTGMGRLMNGRMRSALSRMAIYLVVSEPRI